MRNSEDYDVRIRNDGEKDPSDAAPASVSEGVSCADLAMKEEELRIREEEMLAVQQQSGRIMCRYRIEGRRVELPEAAAAQFGLPAVALDDMPRQSVENGCVQPESVDTWYGLFDAIDRGEESGSAEVWLRPEGAPVGRYRLQFTGIPDRKGDPFSAVVSFEDITREYERNRLQALDIDGLIQATRKVFPELLSVNLTKNTYHMIQYDRSTTRGTPKEGSMTEMLHIRVNAIAPEDKKAFIDAFSRESLLDAFSRGEESVQLVYRRSGQNGEWYWFETIAMRQPNPFDDDILAIAMSRNVDEQKAEESRLRQELQLQAEEIRLSMNRMGRILCYYDIPTGTLTVPSAYAQMRGIPETVSGYPESIRKTPANVRPESMSAFLEFYAAIRRGDSSGVCEVLLPGSDGQERWERLEFSNIFDNEGRPRRAVIAVDDVTELRTRSAENLRLRENERILQMVAQHSDRTICYYDIRKGLARHWSEENCAGCILPHLCERPYTELLKDSAFLPDCIEAFKNMFEDIHAGVPGGVCKLHLKDEMGERHWFDIKHSTIFDKGQQPAVSIISYTEITDAYEQELAYRRYLQSLQDTMHKYLGLIEIDLTADIIEKQGGDMMPPDTSAVGGSLTDFGRRMVNMKFTEKDIPDGLRFFSREYLLTQYADGNRHLSRVWQMRFRGGETGWVRTEVELVADPYTDHVRALLRLTDVSSEWEERLSVQNRAWRDGMTGLLNRATCEEQIRRKLEEPRDKGGILVLLDLDDLKGINDTYGHNQGDRAIRSIAQVLQGIFRSDDIVGRMGGDEFALFLPGAADNISAIAHSMSILLRQLARISIGEDEERKLRCSAGCAVEALGEDTFDSLYQRADMALYHVKRSGKNDFAFFTPEMSLASKEYRERHTLSLPKHKSAFDRKELQCLLGAISSFYPLVLSMNLTGNSYYMMEAHGDGFQQIPELGTVDGFITAIEEMIHHDDKRLIQEGFARCSLLDAYERGERSVRRCFRSRDGSQWAEMIAIFYPNEMGDVCAFGLLRWASERELERSLLRL